MLYMHVNVYKYTYSHAGKHRKNPTAQQTQGQSQNPTWVAVIVCDDFPTMNAMNCAAGKPQALLMKFWAPVSLVSTGAGVLLAAWPPGPAFTGRAGLPPVRRWYPPHRPLPPQVEVLTVTERAVPPTPAAPEDPAPLWGSPAVQGSPGDGGLRGEWVGGEHAPVWE